jgi:hypothetical protein
MGNWFAGIVIPKNGDKVTFGSVHGYYLTTIDGAHLTQTCEPQEGSQFTLIYSGLDKVAIRTGDGKYLSPQGKEFFEFVTECSDKQFFTPVYNDRRIGFKTCDGLYLSATNDFKTKQEEVADETALFNINFVRQSTF